MCHYKTAHHYYSKILIKDIHSAMVISRFFLESLEWYTNAQFPSSDATSKEHQHGSLLITFYQSQFLYYKSWLN